MGLWVSTIDRLPIDSEREYFFYFLDYGWSDAYSNAMYDNFDRLAEGLSTNRGVVAAGFDRMHFANEVLSWHSVNGEPAEGLLPAILVSGLHPAEFAQLNRDGIEWKRDSTGVRKFDGALLLPLRDVCPTPDDVTTLMQNLLSDVKAGRKIREFDVARRMNGANNPSDIFILQPNINGVGVDLKALAKRATSYFSRLSRGDES